MIVTPRNINRAYILQDHSMAVAVDGTTVVGNTVDFKEMVTGSVQADWDGADALTGEIKLFGSSNGVRYSPIKGSRRVLDSGDSRLWSLGVLGFRYLRVTYTPNGTTTGTLTVFALGKISR
jgi:hypothetical protein